MAEWLSVRRGTASSYTEVRFLFPPHISGAGQASFPRGNVTEVDKPSREWKVELHHLERKIPKVSSFGIFLLSLHYGRKK